MAATNEVDEKGVNKELVEEHKVSKENELRIEVEAKERVKLELMDGVAEIFGTELVRTRAYVFEPSSKIAVFTWHGCTVRLTGKVEVAYISKETPMTMYLNTHCAIETLRKKAESESMRGPRTLIVGPQDVGKSTLSRLLLNYAARMGRKPTLIDVDVGQGGTSIPGTISALTVERPADPVEGFDTKVPLVYHFGHTSPNGNFKLYQVLISRVADVFNAKCECNPNVKSSGCIINTCGWIKGQGYMSILHIAEQFEADAVIVLDSERVYNDLKRDLPDFVNIVLLPKSPGVVERSRELRRDYREDRIKEYFYGPNKTYFPHLYDINFSEISIYRIGAPELPDSCLPLGMEQEDSQTKLVLVKPQLDLIHHVLSLSMAESLDENLIETNIAGFVVVTGVDPQRETISVLAPAPYPLPRKHFLIMDISLYISMYKETGPTNFVVSVFSTQGQRVLVNVQSDSIIESVKEEAVKKFSGIKGGGFDNSVEYALVTALGPSRRLSAKNTAKAENLKASDVLLLHKIPNSTEKPRGSSLKVTGIPTVPGIQKATEGLPARGRTTTEHPPGSQGSTGNLEQTFRKILLTLLDLSYKLMFFDEEADSVFCAKKKKTQIDPALISSLTSMGFSEARACKALRINQMDLESAMEWLLHNPEDPAKAEVEQEEMSDTDEDDGDHHSPQRIKRRLELWQEKTKSLQPSKEHIEMLVAMGFTEEESLQALQYNGNNPNAACDWLLGDRKLPDGDPNDSLSPDSELYKAIITDPTIHIGLHNKRVLEALEDMLENPMRRHNWANDSTVGSVILQILKLYHKYSSSVS